MYHQPTRNMLARQSTADLDRERPTTPLDTVAKFCAVLIICALPLILAWLLLRFVVEEVRSTGRGLRAFYLGAAEELARTRTP